MSEQVQEFLITTARVDFVKLTLSLLDKELSLYQTIAKYFTVV